MLCTQNRSLIEFQRSNTVLVVVAGLMVLEAGVSENSSGGRGPKTGSKSELAKLRSFKLGASPSSGGGAGPVPVSD